MKNAILPQGLGVIAIVGIVSSLQSATVFSYGPATNYVSPPDTSSSFSRQATALKTSPRIYTNAFSGFNKLSPSTNYSGPAFYGGYTITSSPLSPTTLYEDVVRGSQFGAGSTAQYLHGIRLRAVNANGWLGSSVSVAGVLIFKQSDFKEGFTFGSISLHGLNLMATRYGGLTNYSLRWVVQVGGNYYISSQAFGVPLNGTSSQSLDGAALSGMTWALYNPASVLTFDSRGAAFSSLNLTHVTAVGIYFSGSVNGENNTQATAFDFELGEFSATGIRISPSAASVTTTDIGTLLALTAEQKKQQ